MPDDDELFKELRTPAVEAYGAIHEMFLTLVASGFTENQALRYIVLWTIEVGNRPDFNPPEGL